MGQIIQRIKFVKVKDILHIFVAVPAALFSVFFRMNHNNIWLVCERRREARDNGYWFYKYLCDYHPEIEAVYAIDYSSPDYRKVAELGKTIKFGGFWHWVYYFAAKRNISSQKEGKPNAALCFVLEVCMGWRNNRAYIHHGIVKDDQRWVYYDVTKMNLYTCAVRREYEFVLQRFGYPSGNVQLVGLCRFDNLLSPHEVKRQILVMPTMREWLRNVSTDTLKYEGTANIEASEYFQIWNRFLHNDELCSLLDKYDIRLIFYPHASLHKYLNLFTTECRRICIGEPGNYDVQQLLMESSCLITDYSSIYFDFAYMEKPLIYYQFDYEKYREGQYQEGYFSYEKDGFGPVVSEEEILMQEIENMLKKNCVMQDKYRSRVNDFFTYRDENNCERTYQAIFEMGGADNLIILIYMNLFSSMFMFLKARRACR